MTPCQRPPPPIQVEMLNNEYPENMKHAQREHVSFCYQKIVWAWMDMGITAKDDWAVCILELSPSSILSHNFFTASSKAPVILGP